MGKEGDPIHGAQDLATAISIAELLIEPQKDERPTFLRRKSTMAIVGETIMLARIISLKRASGTPKHMMSPRMEVRDHYSNASFVEGQIMKEIAKRRPSIRP